MIVSLISMPVPQRPKLYHIAHVDRLASIAQHGLLSDADVLRLGLAGTSIGISRIKKRRLQELVLESHPDLHVGECVPFNFCPRSVMLYLLHMANHAEVSYRGGQGPIIHLRADLNTVIAWANQRLHRWAFTLSNAGANYFEDRCDLQQLDQVNWSAVEARDWRDSRVKEGKQAEFLIEHVLPWALIEHIGVQSEPMVRQVNAVVATMAHKPTVSKEPSWYY